MQTPTPTPAPTPINNRSASNRSFKELLKKHWLKLTGSLVFLATVVAGVDPALKLSEAALENAMTGMSEGQISTPLDDAAVASKVNFEGTIKKIPKSSSLWLFIYAGGIDKYYAYDVDPNREKGTWKCPDIEVGLETDYKQPFKAELVLVNEKDSRQLYRRVMQSTRLTEKGRLKERGFRSKPDGKTLSTVNIIRAPR
jgi:hypothetical protein